MAIQGTELEAIAHEVETASVNISTYAPHFAERVRKGEFDLLGMSSLERHANTIERAVKRMRDLIKQEQGR
jgi:hypothetical protein